MAQIPQNKKRHTRGALCTWAINNFPRETKNRYAAYCKANNATMLDMTEYLISKELRENKVFIPKLRTDNRLRDLFK